MFADDREKHYSPLLPVLAYVSSLIPEGAKVLELGPGTTPFHRSTHFVDLYKKGENYVVCDLNAGNLPFPDDYFDFVYTRHTMEDLYYPFAALREMARVARRGYIETPSPFAEVTRGIDGGSTPTPWRGYHHHQWLVWSHAGELNFLKKIPLIEYVGGFSEEVIERTLANPCYWNTYFYWEGEVKFRERTYDNLTYGDEVISALNQTVEPIHEFVQKLPGQPAG